MALARPGVNREPNNTSSTTRARQWRLPWCCDPDLAPGSSILTRCAVPLLLLRDLDGDLLAVHLAAVAHAADEPAAAFLGIIWNLNREATVPGVVGVLAVFGLVLAVRQAQEQLTGHVLPGSNRDLSLVARFDLQVSVEIHFDRDV